MWWMALVGCVWVGESDLDAVRDRDGDGVDGCAFVDPGQRCDCDDADPDVGEGRTQEWFVDADGDGVGGATSVQACAAPEGFVAEGGDCDDATDQIGPGRPEQCNGLDDDCDGKVDDDQDGDVVGADVLCFLDQDGDGFGSDAAASLEPRCGCPAGYVEVAGDCDDGDATRHPDTVWYLDQDGDGVGAVAFAGVSCVPPDERAAPVGEDCDDQDAAVHPGAAEVPYDGVDSDCSGGTDLAVVEGGPPVWLVDPEPGVDFALGDPEDAHAPCSGTPTMVSGGGDALQWSIDHDPGTWLHVEGGGDEVIYEAITIDGDRCITADAGTVILGRGGAPAVTVVQGRVLMEGLQLDGDVGVSVGDGVEVMLSRVHILGPVEALEGFGSEDALRMHHVEVSSGKAVGDVDSTLLLRHVSVRSMASGGENVFAVGGPWVDVADLAMDAITGAGTALELVSPVVDVHAVAAGGVGVSVLHSEGTLLRVSNGKGEPCASGCADIELTEVQLDGFGTTDPLLRVEVSGDGSVSIRDLDVAGAVDAGGSGASIVVGQGTALTIEDVHLRVDADRGLEVSAADGGPVLLARLALASTIFPLVLDSAPSDVQDLTLVGNTCVSAPATVAPGGRVYASCATTGALDFSGGGANFASNNASCDLFRTSDGVPVSTWDLRPHPGSYLKIGDWAPGFDGTELNETVDGLLYGAFVGGALVEGLWDVDGDGMYDDYGPVGVDADADGLTTEQEFELRTDPEVADTDGDGEPDGSDPSPLGTDDPSCPS